MLYNWGVYRLISLDNGVRLVLVPMPSVPSVSAAVFVACGSRYEPKKISGVSHFLEHMVFKGTKKYPTYDDVHIIEKIGGVQNAYTGTDITKYYAKVLSADWEQTLDVVTDLALAPLLPAKDFDMERKVIYEEMAMHEDDLPDKSGEVFHQLMYGQTGLGRRIIGTQESLARVNREEMAGYRQKTYKAGDVVVVVSGRVDEEKEVEKWVENRFGTLKKEKNKRFERVGEYQGGKRIRVLSKPKAQQANLVLGFPGCSRFSDDKYPLQIFNLLMGVGFTSRFFRKIREELGLCYGISSSVSTYHETGDWGVWAGLNTDRLEEALSAILDQIKLVLDQGVKESEVEISKKRFTTAAAFRMESPEGMGEFYGRQVVYGQPVLTVEEYLKKIEAVTVSDVERVVKKYFIGHKLNLAVVGKFKKTDEDKFTQLLKL